MPELWGINARVKDGNLNIRGIRQYFTILKLQPHGIVKHKTDFISQKRFAPFTRLQIKASKGNYGRKFHDEPAKQDTWPAISQAL